MKFEATADFTSEREPGVYVQKPDLRVLSLIARICTKGERTWVTPRQQTMVELIFKFFGRTMSKRTLSRHVGALVRDGWLDHKLRHRMAPDGSLDCRPSLYVITARSIKWLRSLGANLWKTLAPWAKPLSDIGVTILSESTNPSLLLHAIPAAQAPPRR